jgi:hypothetical protein
MAKDKAGLTHKHQNKLKIVAEGKHTCLQFGDEENKKCNKSIPRASVIKPFSVVILRLLIS